jgi:glucokinase
MEQPLLGFDIGGTKCAVVIANRESDGVRILARRAFPTEWGPEPNLARMEEIAHELLGGLGIGQISGVGISCGGPLDSDRGRVLGPPNLPGWDDVPVAGRLGEAFHVPACLENDANACALAEWMWGAGRGTRNMVFLTFGTGMGAGLILDGRLFRGACGLAGEVGHIRIAEDGPPCYGKRGSFEGLCSGAGIAQLAAEVHPPFPGRGTAADFFAAAESGNPHAQEIVARVGRGLGRGLAMIIDMLSPEIIVLGSIFARREALLRTYMEEIVGQEALSRALAACRIVPSELAEEVGDYGALAAAWNAGRESMGEA